MISAILDTFLPRKKRRQLRVDKVRKLHIGSHSVVDSSVQVYGWKRVKVGRNSVICEETLINAMNRSDDQVSLLIGDSCFIGRRNYFNVGGSLILKDFCLTSLDCRFIGSSHGMDTPFVPYLATETVAIDIIEVGVNCWMGCGVTVLAPVRIGYGSIIGAASVVTKDVPPFSIAVGNPAKVIKRYSSKQAGWVSASEFDEEDSLPDEEEYRKYLLRNYPDLKGPLSASSKRFGDFL